MRRKGARVLSTLADRRRRCTGRPARLKAFTRKVARLCLVGWQLRLLTGRTVSGIDKHCVGNTGMRGFGRPRTRVRGGWYTPLTDDYVLSLLGEAGYIVGFDQDVGIAERFFVGGRIFRGFARTGVGPRDTTTGDALGGNKYYVGTVEVGFPLGLPEDLGIKAFVFTDAGSLWDTDAKGPEVVDSTGIRASVGAGLSWASAFGLIRVDFAQAILKETEDDTEFFRFSFGTRF